MSSMESEIKIATEKWVSEMNRFPRSMVELVFNNTQWEEVTTPAAGDRVIMNDDKGEIINADGDFYEIAMDSGGTVIASVGSFEVERDSLLPSWGTMWAFSDICDNRWLDNSDGIKKMSACGFRVYWNNQYGYFFGIDGGGYDFYRDHWIPLYKSRGLCWHLNNDTNRVSEIRSMFGFKLFANNTSKVVEFITSNSGARLGLRDEEISKLIELAENSDIHAIRSIIGEPLSWAVADIINEKEHTHLFVGSSSIDNELIGIEESYLWNLTDDDIRIGRSFKTCEQLLTKYADELGIISRPEIIDYEVNHD